MIILIMTVIIIVYYDSNGGNNGDNNNNNWKWFFFIFVFTFYINILKLSKNTYKIFQVISNFKSKRYHNAKMTLSACLVIWCKVLF